MNTIKLNIISRTLSTSGKAAAYFANYGIARPASYMFVSVRTFLFGKYFDFDISERSAEASIQRLQQYYEVDWLKKQKMIERLNDMNTIGKAQYNQALNFIENNSKNGILDLINLYWQTCEYLGELPELAKTLNKLNVLQKTEINNVDLTFVKRELAKKISVLDPEVIYFHKNNSKNRNWLYKFEADTVRIKRKTEKERALKHRIKNEGILGWIFRNTVEAVYNKMIDGAWTVVDAILYLPKRLINWTVNQIEQAVNLFSNALLSIPVFMLNSLADGIMNLAGLVDNVINHAVTAIANTVISAGSAVVMSPVNYVKSFFTRTVVQEEQTEKFASVAEHEDIPFSPKINKQVRFVDELPAPERTENFTTAYALHRTQMEEDRAVEEAEMQIKLQESLPSSLRTAKYVVS